ncbi:uncharacterized protein BXZ73DRAFT_77346 [Epithele typhae]|uniref:uncharacterized protein n=1 Tax=Epithele typhae TaxID=378194 RepID=UPI0020082058|nr:uncharacterized protein BXZ73DRAFT_77346 [Epithele typhae]KAH9933184.1 hypothetical protein BXZ73DRAFT_77346 [Epithele typhae]
MAIALKGARAECPAQAFRKYCDRFPPTEFQSLPDDLYPHGSYNDIIPVGSRPDPSVWEREFDKDTSSVHLIHFGWALDEAWALRFAAYHNICIDMKRFMREFQFERSGCPRRIDFANLTPDTITTMQQNGRYWRSVWIQMQDTIYALAERKFPQLNLQLGCPISYDARMMLALFNNHNITKRAWLTGCHTREPLAATIQRVAEWLTVPGSEPLVPMWWYEYDSPLIERFGVDNQ